MLKPSPLSFVCDLELSSCHFVFSEQKEMPVELSELSPNEVNSVVEDVLSKRGVSCLQPLENLRTKFNVRKVFVYMQ